MLSWQSLYKSLATVFLMAAFFAQTFCTSFIVAGYYTNTAAYTKNCENKARPAMHCNGKCQLMKKLRQQEKKDQENPNRKAESKKQTFLSSRSFFAAVSNQVATEMPAVKITLTAASELSSPALDIFHPPRA